MRTQVLEALVNRYAPLDVREKLADATAMAEQDRKLRIEREQLYKELLQSPTNGNGHERPQIALPAIAR